MATRIIGMKKDERRRDRRRDIVIGSTLDGIEIDVRDMSLSGFGASGVKKRKDATFWPVEGQRSELRFTDYKGREVLILVEITYVSTEAGRFSGRFYELPGKAFDVIQDLVMLRDLRASQAG
jgi:hypothetical protein